MDREQPTRALRPRPRGSDGTLSAQTSSLRSFRFLSRPRQEKLREVWDKNIPISLSSSACMLGLGWRGHGPALSFLRPLTQTTYSIHADSRSLLPLLSIPPLEGFHPLALVSQHRPCRRWTLVSHLNQWGCVLWSWLLEWRITWLRGMSLRPPYIGPGPMPGFCGSCWDRVHLVPQVCRWRSPLGCFPAYREESF